MLCDFVWSTVRNHVSSYVICRQCKLFEQLISVTDGIKVDQSASYVDKFHNHDSPKIHELIDDAKNRNYIETLQ